MSQEPLGRRQNGQFAKGHCQYRGGRGPSKRPGARSFDFAAFLNKPIILCDAKGQQHEKSPLEFALRRQTAKASKGDVRAARYFLELCITYDVLQTQSGGGAVTYSKDMPIALARLLVERYGRPPWTSRQIANGAARLKRNGGGRS